MNISEVLTTYRFHRVKNGLLDLTNEIPDDQKLACVTCPGGNRAIERAIARTHEWKACEECGVEFSVEDSLHPPVIKVYGPINCD